MSAPDLTTEVIGYRQWRVTQDLRLRGAHKSSQLWTPGENHAVCDPDSDRPSACAAAPTPECRCGLYALHDPSDFWYGKKDLWSMFLSIPNSDPLVSGVIAAWGNMEVHHEGFRAQSARVVALAVPEGRRDSVVARAAAAEHGVPLVPIDELPRIAAEFGLPVPTEMRPERVAKPEPSPLAQIVGGQYQRSPFWTPPSSSYYWPPSTTTHTNVTWSFDPGVLSPPPTAPRKRTNRQGPPRPKRPPKNMRPGKGL